MRRLSVCGIWLAAMSASEPVVSAPAPPTPAAREALTQILSGPIERVPLRWGGPEMTEPFDPAFVLSTSLYGPAPAAPPPPEEMADALEAPPPPATGSQAGPSVAPLEVRARQAIIAIPEEEKCLTGPAWWRVSDSDTVLWVMGTPDEIPLNTKWDDKCLDKRISQARVVLLPNQPLAVVNDPYSRADTDLRIQATPLSERLPAPIAARIFRRIDNNETRARAEAASARRNYLQVPPPGSADQKRLEASSGEAALAALRAGTRGSHRPFASNPNKSLLQVLNDTPNELAPVILVADRLAAELSLPGALGNPAVKRAELLANRHNVLAGHTKASAAQFRSMTYTYAPTEAQQQVCLAKVLDALDGGRTGLWRLRQVQAWADGDHQSALRRLNIMSTCAYGDASVRFWSALVAQYMELIERAMDEPGVAVALVELDPLFLNNGVMDRMREKGWTIAPPEALR